MQVDLSGQIQEIVGDKGDVAGLVKLFNEYRLGIIANFEDKKIGRQHDAPSVIMKAMADSYGSVLTMLSHGACPDEAVNALVAHIPEICCAPILPIGNGKEALVLEVGDRAIRLGSNIANYFVKCFVFKDRAFGDGFKREPIPQILQSYALMDMGETYAEVLPNINRLNLAQHGLRALSNDEINAFGLGWLKANIINPLRVACLLQGYDVGDERYDNVWAFQREDGSYIGLFGDCGASRTLMDSLGEDAVVKQYIALMEEYLVQENALDANIQEEAWKLAFSQGPEGRLTYFRTLFELCRHHLDLEQWNGVQDRLGFDEQLPVSQPLSLDEIDEHIAAKYQQLDETRCDRSAEKLAEIFQNDSHVISLVADQLRLRPLQL
ncbi:hypothetical protein GC177_04905 [bacterium]|nr:hypothetical protein [bacterium]